MAAADLSGYDLQLDWGSEVGPGTLTLAGANATPLPKLELFSMTTVYIAVMTMLHKTLFRMQVERVRTSVNQAAQAVEVSKDVLRRFVAEGAIQCGYCYNGMVVKGAELLASIPEPSESQIRSALSGHLCRCGTYPRITKAIQRAAIMMKSERNKA